MGNKFTLCKNFPDGSTIWEWLDRAVCNDEWLTSFPASKVVMWNVDPLTTSLSLFTLLVFHNKDKNCKVVIYNYLFCWL